tara:strand:- start:207 stop:1604 length:1398 start_codon:yes stop_codon:yes gene_type:complete
MPYTLQRKMFKLGGSVAHGGGITANLKDPKRKQMNKGGFIPQRVGYQPKDHPARQGNREGHAGPLALLTMGASRFAPALLNAIRGRGLGSLTNLVKGGQETAAFGKGFNPITGTIKNVITKPATKAKGKPGTKGYKPGKDAVRKDMGRDEYMKFLKDKDPEKFKKLFGDYGFGKFGRGMQTIRGAQAGILPAAGAGFVSNLFPDYEQKPDTPIRNFADTVLREIPEGVETALTSIPTGVAGLLAGQGTAGFKGLGNVIQGNVYDDKVGSSLVDQSTTGKTLEQQKSRMEKLQEQALANKELYEQIMYQPDKLKVGSDVLLQSGMEALRGGELADVVEAGAAPLSAEAERKRTIGDAAGQQAVTDILNQDAVDRQMLAEVSKTGDPKAIARVQRYIEASNNGVDNILPLTPEGTMDTSPTGGMSPGGVYADIEGATGKLYVAVNESGSEIKQFDTIEDAIEHSRST